MNKAKHFFNLVWFVLKTAYKTLIDRRTWIIVGLLLAFYLWGWFNANYYTQSPVKQWQPIVMPRYSVKHVKNAPTMTVQDKEEKKPVVVAQTVKAPVVPLTEEQIVKQAKHGDELWNIYMLESTRGKNDGCRKSGQFAGFGVMGANGVQCYPTFEKAVERASYWYERIRKDNDLDTSLCIWNLGVKQPMCKYSMTYHTL